MITTQGDSSQKYIDLVFNALEDDSKWENVVARILAMAEDIKNVPEDEIRSFKKDVRNPEIGFLYFDTKSQMFELNKPVPGQTILVAQLDLGFANQSASLESKFEELYSDKIELQDFMKALIRSAKTKFTNLVTRQNKTEVTVDDLRHGDVTIDQYIQFGVMDYRNVSSFDDLRDTEIGQRVISRYVEDSIRSQNVHDAMYGIRDLKDGSKYLQEVVDLISSKETDEILENLDWKIDLEDFSDDQLSQLISSWKMGRHLIGRSHILHLDPEDDSREYEILKKITDYAGTIVDYDSYTILDNDLIFISDSQLESIYNMLDFVNKMPYQLRRAEDRFRRALYRDNKILVNDASEVKKRITQLLDLQQRWGKDVSKLFKRVDDIQDVQEIKTKYDLSDEELEQIEFSYIALFDK